jgi:DNA-binding NarL/FixJ family response regulator
MVGGLKNDSDRALHEILSPRELQIFCMIGSGKTVTEIANEFTLGVGTYRGRIMAKTTLKIMRKSQTTPSRINLSSKFIHSS